METAAPIKVLQISIIIINSFPLCSLHCIGWSYFCLATHSFFKQFYIHYFELFCHQKVNKNSTRQTIWTKRKTTAHNILRSKSYDIGLTSIVYRRPLTDCCWVINDVFIPSLPPQHPFGILSFLTDLILLWFITIMGWLITWILHCKSL